jgi:hypothetical protein
MAAIIVPVGLWLASRCSARALPLVVGLLVGIAIVTLGTLTGGTGVEVGPSGTAARPPAA